MSKNPGPSNFGHIAMAPKRAVVMTSFWIDADRVNFSATCAREYEARMRGSDGEKKVGAVPVIGQVRDDRMAGRRQ